MGTETGCQWYLRMALPFNIYVKLNNPQMGTETLTAKRRQTEIYLSQVKLNNPQMGTETVLS